MQNRVAALFTHDEQGRIESINQWNGGAAPRFYLGRTPAGTIWHFRTDVPSELVDELQRLCQAEPWPDNPRQPPLFRDEYVRILSSHAPVERVWSGPAYWLATRPIPGAEPIPIRKENAHLLRDGMEEWLPDVPHRQPFLAIVEDGCAVSVCASVRITDAAHEAGVETLPAYRGQGHAVNAVAGWANAVLDRGAIPFYSTSWDNVASQKVAARLELSMLGVDFHCT